MRDTKNIDWGIRDDNILRDRNSLISIGGMRDRFEIVGGMRDLNGKRPFENLTRRNRDKAKTSGGMRVLKVSIWTLRI